MELSGVGRKVIIVDSGVYDVESYLGEHPGGSEIILDTVGTDATEAFNDSGHSLDALEQMHNFKIGTCTNAVGETFDKLDTEIIESTDFGARAILFCQVFLGAIIGLVALMCKLFF